MYRYECCRLRCGASEHTLAVDVNSSIYTLQLLRLFCFLGIDFRLKTVEVKGKTVKVQVWVSRMRMNTHTRAIASIVGSLFLTLRASPSPSPPLPLARILPARSASARSPTTTTAAHTVSRSYMMSPASSHSIVRETIDTGCIRDINVLRYTCGAGILAADNCLLSFPLFFFRHP